MPIPKAEKVQKSTASAAAPGAGEGRKPWKKKSPVEVVIEQADKLRKEIAADEAALNARKQELKKFDEAIKLFQGT